MRYRVGCVVAFVCLCFFFSRPAFAESSLRVNESAIRFDLAGDAAIVDLLVENRLPTGTSGSVSIELLDPRDHVDSQLTQMATFPPGKTHLRLLLPVLSERPTDAISLAWHRLRYSIALDSTRDPSRKSITGIISVSEAAPRLFELHVAQPAFVNPGGSGTILVRAVHPATLHPIDGVVVRASLDIDSDDQKPVTTNEATTDARGFATLRYSIPGQIDQDEIDVTVTGKLGNLTASAQKEIFANHSPDISISTDKFLYQPGQTIHVRALDLDPNQKPVTDQKITAQFYDPDYTLVYSAQGTTSRFGVAAVDWPVPANLRLGTYRIQVYNGDASEVRHSTAEVKISRYDLPTFAVQAKPDRAYYLPGETADVQVAADYLFGQPVTRGHVRVVRETERTWNYREQKWDTKVAATYEGDTDPQGRYLAHLDLAGDQSDLAADDYELFRDLAFAAYFTDASTGKTEEKRFDVRITKEPIHVYTLGLGWEQAKGSPLEFYLSVDYADGTPAECDVDIDWPGTAPSWKKQAALPEPRFLRRVRTNRYGIAKVSGLNLPIGEDVDSFDLSFRAKDRKGWTGRHTESVMLRDGPGILVKTDKSLYAPGEPIGVELSTTARATTLVVEARHDYQVIERQFVRVRRGHAFLVFSPSNQFRNEVSIAAYFLGGRNEGPYRGIGFRAVYFPRRRGMNVDVRMSKTSYKPGEQAYAAVRVTSLDGAPKHGDLGVVVVDRAVEERAAADAEYSGNSGFFGALKHKDYEQGLQGVEFDDLDKLDLSKPLPDGMDLLAEAMLEDVRFGPDVYGGGAGDTDFLEMFRQPLNDVLNPSRNALDSRYNSDGKYPADEAALQNELAAAGIRLDDLRDPWGTQFRPAFRIENDRDVLAFESAGPDKMFGNDDDFTALEMSWPYFKPTADAIQHAVDAFHARTGGYLRDEKLLQEELARQGIDLASLKDSWGHGYRIDFGVDRARYTVTVRSAGPDGRFATQSEPSDDDFTLSTALIDYFNDTSTRIGAALNDAYNRDHVFPDTKEQLEQILQKAGIRLDELRDPWGHPYYAMFQHQALYADDVSIQTYEAYVGKAQLHMTVTPVTRQMNFIYLRSAGEDGAEGTRDDFTVAAYSRYAFQESAAGVVAPSTEGRTITEGATGAISGTVTDLSGGIISGVAVSARLDDSGYVSSATADENGKYVLRNLTAGSYVVEFSARGFHSTKILAVPVRSSSVTLLDAVLNVGEVNQTVTVSEAVPLVETTSAALAANAAAVTGLARPNSTPRLREYFPETLYWQPEVVTDRNGLAEIRFPLADSITTWKLSVIASTEAGEIGMAEKEIRAFQPFFAEHDPPRFLTEGDEINLPVVLRNYLDHDLQITTDLKPEPWFTALGPASAKTAVPRRESASALFRFRATQPVSDGKQRITAVAADAADAIERKVTVRPNGEERVASASQILGDETRIEIRVPEDALPGSINGTLKIYPNLQAHLLESIEAIQERPYGCAEQIISAAYPSVLLLRYAKNGKGVPAPNLARAKSRVELAYQQLLSDIREDGGVTYWGRGEADPALSAYAMKFLADASEFIDVDDQAVDMPLRWLLHGAPQEGGRWIYRDWTGKEDRRQSLLLTTYIARTIAAAIASRQGAPHNAQLAEEAESALRKALDYLEPEVRRVDDPYILASFGLAALSLDKSALVKESVGRLARLEHREGDFSYWSLETNTPFYGWGLAGRIETTALVLEFFSKSGADSGEVRDVSARGLLFLLHNKDRFGVWYSTQATIQVLDTIGALTASGPAASGAASRNSAKASILVDGRQALTVDLPAPAELATPVYVDLSQFLSAGAHTVEIDRGAGAPAASAQLVAAYYTPWTQVSPAENVIRPDKSSEALRLSVHFEKSQASVGDTIHCTVNAERVGFRGYGMMIAEIGLPPGSDVDRGSLDKSMAESGWEINSYDILPDRVVLYLWPRAGGTKFSFAFKLRYGMTARTAASVLYDYYNPEARAVVAPADFKVR